MIRHFIFAVHRQRWLAVMARTGAPPAVGVLPPAMGQPARQGLLMTAISLAALLTPRGLAASVTTVNLPAITVGADEVQRSASAAKALAEERFRGSRHRCREGLDSRRPLLAR